MYSYLENDNLVGGQKFTASNLKLKLKGIWFHRARERVSRVPRLVESMRAGRATLLASLPKLQNVNRGNQQETVRGIKTLCLWSAQAKHVRVGNGLPKLVSRSSTSTLRGTSGAAGLCGRSLFGVIVTPLRKGDRDVQVNRCKPSLLLVTHLERTEMAK
jgi:hypothetical protein